MKIKIILLIITFLFNSGCKSSPDLDYESVISNEDCYYFEDHTYIYIKETYTWEQANELCEYDFKIKNSEKLKEIKEYLYGVSTEIISVTEELPLSAVINIDIYNMSDYLGTFIIDLLNGSLLNSGKYRVIDSIVTESVLQESSRFFDCDNIPCLLEIGEFLGAELVITGSITRTGTILSIIIKAVHIATGIEFVIIDNNYNDLTELAESIYNDIKFTIP